MNCMPKNAVLNTYAAIFFLGNTKMFLNFHSSKKKNSRKSFLLTMTIKLQTLPPKSTMNKELNTFIKQGCTKLIISDIKENISISIDLSTHQK